MRYRGNMHRCIPRAFSPRPRTVGRPLHLLTPVYTNIGTRVTVANCRKVARERDAQPGCRERKVSTQSRLGYAVRSMREYTATAGQTSTQ